MIEYKNIHDVRNLIKRLLNNINNLEIENLTLSKLVMELQTKNEMYKNTEYLFD